MLEKDAVEAATKTKSLSEKLIIEIEALIKGLNPTHPELEKKFIELAEETRRLRYLAGRFQSANSR